MITQKQKEKIVNLLKLYECFGIKYMPPISLSHNKIKRSEVLPRSYEKLKEHIEHCNLCELSKSCSQKIGLNDPSSNFYIVGLGCNFLEPTIGNYVQYYFKELFGLDFKEVYMTNIIKCETNNENGVDHASAALVCQEYFFQELSIQKPKYIFATLEACRYLLKTDSNDNSLIGKSFKIGESTVFPIFDFSFISKNPSYKQEMERVLKKIKGLIH